MWFLDWRRFLVYTHRWLGIAGGIVFIVWFASGIVMMYARMPVLTLEERLARLPTLDLATARLSPVEAVRAVGVSPERVEIGMYGGKAAYRFLVAGRWTTVSAETGTPLEPLTADAALRVARELLPAHSSTIAYDALLDDADQWSFAVRRLMPIHRVAIGDADDTYLYVSDQTGGPVLKTTSRQRLWGFLGAVLHWIYFTSFRRLSTVWAQTIIWSSMVGCVMCLSGLAWGVWRLSPRSRYRLKRERSHSPYAGLMWWHHYAGLLFGVVTFTWILSGLLSMTPWDWSPGTAPTRQQRSAVQGGPLRLESVSLARLREAARTMPFPVKELEIAQFAGEPLLLAYRAGSLENEARWASAYFDESPPPEHRLVSLIDPSRGAFARFDDAAMVAAGMAAMPDAPVESVDWLHAYDAYYYDRHRARPLPVLRMRFADADRTWLYLDPRTGAILNRYQRTSRLNRWLYHGLHSLDFPFLYDQRPLWDIVVIVLSLGGLGLSATTLVPAFRRLRRHARRLATRGT